MADTEYSFADGLNAVTTNLINIARARNEVRAAWSDPTNTTASVTKPGDKPSPKGISTSTLLMVGAGILAVVLLIKK